MAWTHPASRLGGTGIPFRAVSRDPSTPTTPLIASRAPSGHAGGSTPAVRPGGTLLGFAPLQRVKSHGSGHRGIATPRHLPSSAFRTLSTVYAPQLRPGLSRPGNAHGVPVFRDLLLPGQPHLFRGRCSLAVHPAHRAAKPWRRSSTPELCSPRRVSCRRRPKSAAADSLLTSCPSKALSTAGVGSACSPAALARP